MGDRKMENDTELAGAGLLGDEELMFQLAAAVDRELSERLFNEVYSRYHNRVVGWCARTVPGRDSAVDLAQEVFLKAWRHRTSFRGDSRLSTWLFAITRNHCLTAVRKQGRPMLPIDASMRDTIGENRRDAASTAESCEMSSRMLRLMRRTLEPLEVRVMALHYGHEVPLSAITRQLELTNPSGAKAYIVNARRKLQGAAKRRGWDVLLAASPRQVPWDCLEAA